MGEGAVVERFPDRPITMDDLVADLAAIGLSPGSVVIVHSSLSKIGWVCGGEQTVIRSIMSAVRSYGTVIMPAHSSHLSDPALWRNPPVPESWWETIRETMPAFEPEITPTRGVGRIPELFRTMPEVIRSNHPHVSFAGWGEEAIPILSDHELEQSLGEGSPLARLYDADATVLLLGAGFETNTCFHLAEYRADYPTKEAVSLGAPVLIDGHRRWKSFSDINYDSDDFGEIGKAFLKSYKQQVNVAKIGNAESYLFPLRLAVDFAVGWISRHRY